jgi:hypothetical protein
MTVYQALITIIGFGSFFGCGWIAREWKYERDQTRVEIVSEITEKDPLKGTSSEAI